MQTLYLRPIISLNNPHVWRAMIMLLSILLSTACAQTYKANTNSMRAAEQSIESAERARVSVYAASELMQARDLLNRARLAVKQDDMLGADRLAQQSEATAQLAFARAELYKAEQINAEMAKSIAQLEQEMQRNHGDIL